jgi:hypothetical protein
VKQYSNEVTPELTYFTDEAGSFKEQNKFRKVYWPNSSIIFERLSDEERE